MSEVARSSQFSGKAVLWLGFYAAILAAWAALYVWSLAMADPDLPAGFLTDLCLSPRETSFPSLFGMWVVMIAAMMLPTFAPALRSYMDLEATGAASLSGAAALVAGYAVVWLGGAALGAGVQAALAGLNMVAQGGRSLSVVFTAALLLAAGLYQFSMLKAACLSRCRLPLTFFLERWSPGRLAALRMGFELGILCFGCCAALMALAFVGGTMNLLWMGAATLFMLIEKLPDLGRPLTRPLGLALIAASLFALFTPFIRSFGG